MENNKKIEIAELERDELLYIISVIEQYKKVYKSKKQEFKSDIKIPIYIEGYLDALENLKNYIICEIETLNNNIKDFKNKSMI